MNIKNMPICRYLQKTDNLEEVGALLYYTDPYIYPAFLGSLENAKKIVAEAIKRELYCFTVDNIYAAFLNDLPVALICKIPPGNWKWDSDEWAILYEELGIKLPETFRHAAENYFYLLSQENLNEAVYILAVSVSPDLRKNGIGTELMNQFLKIHDREVIILDTLLENNAALSLYENAGFTIMEEYAGYSLTEPLPRCVRMVKKNCIF